VLTVGPLEADGRASEVEVLALKTADRGEGLVVRLADRTGAGQVRCRLDVGRAVEAAVQCDVRERDLGPLEVRATSSGSQVDVALDTGIVSVRLVLAQEADR